MGRGNNAPSGVLRFVAKNKTLVHASGSDVKLVALATGEVVHTLRGHETDIVAVCESAWDVTQIISLDRSGCLKVWDLENGRCLQTVPKSELTMIAGNYGIMERKFAVSSQNGNASRNNNNPWRLCKIEIVPGAKGKAEVRVLNNVYKSRGAKCLQLIQGGCARAAEEKGPYVVCVTKQVIVVHDTVNGEVYKLSHTLPFTCADIHPTKDIIIAGDTDGQIIVFRKDGPTSFASTARTILHWHANPVGSLAFSSDGNNFISGGQESVLVVWQLETGARVFLPRLGGVITRVTASTDGAHYAVLMETSAIKIIDARTRRVVRVLQALTAVPRVARRPRIGLVVDPRSGAVLIQRTPGSLQFFDMAREKQLGSVDVVARNSLNKTEADRPVIPTNVDRVAFVPGSGSRMATVERRLETLSLKFWSLVRNGNGAQTSFEVTTQVQQPHKKPVVALLMHPRGDMAITASKDSTFKVWSRKQGSGEWFCRSVGFYRSSPILAADLSQDGSVLALAYEDLVTLWNPMTNSLIDVCAHPRPERGATSVTHVAFFRQTLMAVATSAGAVYVWDTIEGRVLWSVKVGTVNALQAHQSQILVVAQNRHLLVFEDKPVPVRHEVLKLRTGEPVDVSFLSVKSGYAVLTDRDEVELVACTSSHKRQENEGDEAEALRQSNYALVHNGGAKTQVEDLPRRRGQDGSQLAKHGPVLDMLDAYPSSILPSISKLAQSLLNDDGEEDQDASASESAGSSRGGSQKQLAGKKRAAPSPAAKSPSAKKSKASAPQDANSDATVATGEDDATNSSKARLQDKRVEESMTEFFRNAMWKGKSSKASRKK
mmetsp:Transcript_16720/g.32491  ORF Transcript_16720/g.32491 Transcript_16720/m.32491 type:complete len:829 (+) Transcript_16720:142-2628(+)